MAEPDESVVELPAPTPWPMIAALGIAFGFAGLVMHWIVTVVGVVLTIAGAVGWFRAVLPVEELERVELPSPARRIAPVGPSPRPVEHLAAGPPGPRAAVPVEIHPYSAGVWGGLAGGGAMAVLAVLYGVLAYGSPWYPINLLAAVLMPALGNADLLQLTAFNAPALAVGVVVHAVTSIFVGLVYAAILPTLPSRAEFWGGVVAPLLWTGVLWALLGLINPTLNRRIDWWWFIASQIAFGLTCGLVIARTERIATIQGRSFAARAGIEAPGVSEEKGEQ